MSDTEHTDVWSPPPGRQPGPPPGEQPTWLTPRGRRFHPDVQVWPPRRRFHGPSTAPMPAVPDEDPGGDAPAAARRRLPTPVRVSLQILAALTLTGALLGVRGWDAYGLYLDNAPPAVRFTPVTAGQSVDLKGATWQLAQAGRLANAPKTPPDRQWLQLALRVTANDEDGTKFASSFPAADLRDASGRTWRAEVLKNPDELRAGVPASFTLVGVVPSNVADRVELVLWMDGSRDAGQALRFAR